MRAFQAVLFACVSMASLPANSQTPAGPLTVEEQALCRTDAIPISFFRLGDTTAVRDCLRAHLVALSAPFLSLLQARGN
jgi:hypothetical protein